MGKNSKILIAARFTLNVLARTRLVSVDVKTVMLSTEIPLLIIVMNIWSVRGDVFGTDIIAKVGLGLGLGLGTYMENGDST